MLIFVKLWILKKYARRLLRASIQGLSLRVQIFREVIGNICAHTDYQPGFGGYVEVFYDRVITRNATRLIPTMKEGELTLDELGPYTKNPLIVKVLNELHFVEDLILLL